MRKNVVCGGDVPLRLALYGSRALMRAVMNFFVPAGDVLLPI